MNTLLSLSKLNAGYKDLQILKDVSLELEKGSISILMGPNGAGKSTLLKSIFNITDITSGSIMFEGKHIEHCHTHELLHRGISFVSQGKVNFGILSVEENLLMGAHHIQDNNIVKERIKKVYSQFPILESKKSEYAFSLSGGQQQMLAIGRALMSSPTLLLMDEPSLGLAPKLVKELFQHILEIRKEFNTTILIVEHNIKSLMDIADYGFVLMQGEVVAHDACARLKNSDIMKKVFVGHFE